MTTDPAAHPAHERPLAARIVNDLIRKFITNACDIASAGTGAWTAEEQAKQRAIAEMRNLHLAGWHYRLTPQILDALCRAGLLGDTTGATADAAPYDAGDAPTASRPLPTRDDLNADGIRWNTTPTDYLHNLADKQLATIRRLDKRSGDHLAEADQARHERDLLVEAIAKLTGQTPEQVAQTHKVGYTGPALPDDYCPDGPHGVDPDDDEPCDWCGWQATP